MMELVSFGDLMKVHDAMNALGRKIDDMRTTCRYCSRPMMRIVKLAHRENGQPYAHMACVEREREE